MERYPQELEGPASLRDGTRVVVRAIRAEDAPRLERLFYRLSPTTLYRRFFTLFDRPEPGALRYLAEVDYDRRLAVVAVAGDEIVGVARYDRTGTGTEAEAAVLTEDAWQGRGVATVLLARLAAAARARGVTAFVATALGENRAVVRLLRGLSDDTRIDVVDGQYRVRAPLADDG